MTQKDFYEKINFKIAILLIFIIVFCICNIIINFMWAPFQRQEILERVENIEYAITKINNKLVELELID